jgi:hypothetical protein
MPSQRDQQSHPQGPPMAPASQGAVTGPATLPTDAIGGKPRGGPVQPKPIAPGVSGSEPTPHLPAPSPPYKNLRSGR